MAKTIYEKSNEITSVRLNSFSKAYAYKVLLSLESSCDREEKRIGDLKEKLGN